MVHQFLLRVKRLCKSNQLGNTPKDVLNNLWEFYQNPNLNYDDMST